MQNTKHKKGHLCSAWKKAVLGLAVLATVSAGLPSTANAQSLQQAQAQVQMANCNSNYVNAETDLSRNTYATYQQRQVRDQQIRAQYNLCVARVQSNYGGNVQQPYYGDQAPAYQAPPTQYYGGAPSYYQPQNGNDVAGAIIGTIGGIFLGHALHELEEDGHHRGGDRGHYRGQVYQHRFERRH